MADIIKQVKDNEGNNVLPITHVNAVRDSNGDTLPDILDRDYPTTSKTPVEGSTEVSLVTRGEKYEWNKVGNATTSTTVAQTDGVVLKTTSGSYVEVARDSFTEAVRSVLGGLVANLDKGTGISAALGIDSNNDLGTITPANLASMLSAATPNTDMSNFTIFYNNYGDAPKIVRWLDNSPMLKFANRSSNIINNLGFLYADSNTGKLIYQNKVNGKDTTLSD